MGERADGQESGMGERMGERMHESVTTAPADSTSATAIDEALMKNPSVWALRPRSWLSTSGYVVPYIEDATEPSTFTRSSPRTFGRRAISKGRSAKSLSWNCG
mgnify:CR=1 FL=1